MSANGIPMSSSELSLVQLLSTGIQKGVQDNVLTPLVTAYRQFVEQGFSGLVKNSPEVCIIIILLLTLMLVLLLVRVTCYTVIELLYTVQWYVCIRGACTVVCMHRARMSTSCVLRQVIVLQ
jgi:hypothetical protein